MNTQDKLLDIVTEKIAQAIQDQLEDLIDDIIDNTEPFDGMPFSFQRMFKEALLKEVSIAVEVGEI